MPPGPGRPGAPQGTCERPPPPGDGRWRCGGPAGAHAHGQGVQRTARVGHQRRLSPLAHDRRVPGVVRRAAWQKKSGPLARPRPIWSERQDSNLRPPAPEAGALPSCATPRWQCEYSARGLTTQCRWEADSKRGRSFFGGAGPAGPHRPTIGGGQWRGIGRNLLADSGRRPPKEVEAAS